MSASEPMTPERLAERNHLIESRCQVARLRAEVVDAMKECRAMDEDVKKEIAGRQAAEAELEATIVQRDTYQEHLAIVLAEQRQAKADRDALREAVTDALLYLDAKPDNSVYEFVRMVRTALANKEPSDECK